MASTYRHNVVTEEAEKENPLNVPIKVKVPSNASSKILNSYVVAPLALKDAKQQQGRANFSIVDNTTKNIRNVIGGGNVGINNQKIAFRELNNVNKVKVENGENILKSTYIERKVNALVTSKTSILPVEQFKTFSVYEDENDGFIDTTTTTKNQQQQHHETNSITINTVNEKDVNCTVANCNKDNQLRKDKVHKVEQQKQQQVQAKGLLNERSNGVLAPKYDYIVNTTPMSVSEALSPMSVDRSTLTSQSSTDDSNSNEITEQTADDEHLLQSIPYNNRQRFFEVVEYQRDILKYFRDSEKKHRPKAHYMNRQNDINYSMRTILIDWLVEVSEEYKLNTETLYLSVSYIDRFLSHMSVVRNKLQLVGTAAMYIASKYEEIYPPDVSEFVFITDDTYTKAQVLRMEQIILKVLAFDLCTPTAYVYVNSYAVLIDITDRVKYLTFYICELSLLEADPYLRFLPSIISAASLALARYICNSPVWSTELEEITSYRLEDMKEVFLCLAKSHTNAVALSQQAVQEKYKSEKYHSVSSIKSVPITEDEYNVIVENYNETQQQNLTKSKEYTTMALTREPLKMNSFFKF